MLLAFLIITHFNYSQDFRFGKVSKEELLEKEHPLDPDANAAVLYKKENIKFDYVQGQGFVQQREIHERVKIYNKEGYDWATEKIYLYQGSSGASKETVSNIKGYTFNLKDGKVEREKLRNDGIFEEELNEFTDVHTITMPDIQDGCVIEYTYKISSPFSAIDDVYFQYAVPINKLDIRVATPQYAKYNKLANLRASYFPKVKESRVDRLVTFNSSSRSGAWVSQTTFSSSKEKYFDNVLEITDENIPALKSESFLSSLDNYVSKMSFEMVASLNEYGAIEKSFADDWEGVSKSIYKFNSFGGQFGRTKFFQDDIAGFMAEANTPFAKAAVLSEFVKSKVKWNGIYGFTASKGIRDAYKEGEGNVGDINLLLITMLKSQGVNAYPVLVSTKNNGIPLYATRKGFNYVICMVEDGDSYALVDATDRYSTLNTLPNRVINWQGRLIKDEESSAWISLMPNTQSVISNSLNVKFEDDMSLTGKVRQMMTSNLALRYKHRYLGVGSEDLAKMLEKDKGAIEVSNVDIEDKNFKGLSVSYDYELSDAVDDIAGKVYVSPLLFMAEKENPFKLDERKYPVEFSVPYKDKYIVNMMVPDGYTVESLPKTEGFQFKDGEVKYTFVAKQNGKFIQLSTEFDLKTPIISSEDYKTFKEFYGKIIEKQSEQIVLTKS